MGSVRVLQWLQRQDHREWWKRFFSTLRFSLYVIIHPFDGFWDLTREKRGSMRAANFILIMLMLTRILTLQYTSFLFIHVYWQQVNLFVECLVVAVPIIIFCVANWSLTTLFDGKGRMKDIYIGTVYAMTPIVLIQLPLILLSNVVTVEEGAIYSVLTSLSMIWSGLLLVSAMMMIHDYTLAKTIAFMIMALFGALVILFVLLILFSLISDFAAYFISLYKELAFRLY